MRRALIGAISEASSAGYAYGIADRRGGRKRPRRTVPASEAFGTSAGYFVRGYRRAFILRPLEQIEMNFEKAGSGRKTPIRPPVRVPAGPRKPGRLAEGAPAPAAAIEER